MARQRCCARRSRRATASTRTRIVCGAGSDELLTLLAHAYLGPGDEAIFTEHGFLLYRIIVLANGATPVVAPETELRTDVDEILARVTERTKIVFLANPNNPTGTYSRSTRCARCARGCRRNVLLVLDAAYAEYVHRNDYEAGIELVATTRQHGHDAHLLQDPRAGRAAPRLGLLPGGGGRRAQPHPRAVQRVGAGDRRGRRGDRRQGARGSRGGAQRALAAVAGRGDRQARAQGDAERRQLHAGAFPKGEAQGADAADEFLKARGIIVRRVGAYGLPDCLRITIGTEADNRAVVAALADFLGGRPA